MSGRRAGILLLILSLAAQTLCAQAELWDRAAALADLGKDLLPGTMTSVMEELNGDGSVKSVEELVLRYSYDSTGKVNGTEVVRALRDGKDVTEERRKDMQKQGSRANGGPNAFGFNGMLFDPETRKKTRLLPGASWVERNGRKAGLIPFEISEKGKGSMTGTAEIDAVTGVPTLIRTTASFPFVKDLSFTMEYAAFPTGGLVLSRMEFAGAVSALFLNMRFRARMELGDYRSYGPRA